MAEPTPEPRRVAEDEIADLERLLREKKEALAAEGRAVEEREAFRETFRERYGESLAPKTPLAPQPSPLPADEISRHAEELKAKAREDQLEHLIAVALAKGVVAAAEVARHATPWLMDELHDRLQDRYYEKLVTLRKLKAL